MLSNFFEAPERIRAILDSPSGALVEVFANYLFQSGYAEITARRHIRSAEHISFWAHRRGLSVNELDGAALQRFGDHLTRCRCGHGSR